VLRTRLGVSFCGSPCLNLHCREKFVRRGFWVTGQRRWSKAKTGEGQVVLLSGEAGIGKSRLTAALLEKLTGEPHTRLRYFCSPQRTDSAFYPIIGQMERSAGFAYDDRPPAKLDKLDAALAQTSTSGQDAALFAEMLSLPNDGRYPALELTPEQRRQREQGISRAVLGHATAARCDDVGALTIAPIDDLLFEQDDRLA
jgi:predicted ATPase